MIGRFAHIDIQPFLPEEAGDLSGRIPHHPAALFQIHRTIGCGEKFKRADEEDRMIAAQLLLIGFPQGLIHIPGGLNSSRRWIDQQSREVLTDLLFQEHVLVRFIQTGSEQPETVTPDNRIVLLKHYGLPVMQGERPRHGYAP